MFIYVSINNKYIYIHVYIEIFYFLNISHPFLLTPLTRHFFTEFDKVPIKGFVTQGCKVNSTACGTSQSSSIALLPIVTYTTTVTCCSTDKCNPVDTSDATTVKMTFTAAMGAAVLASAWGSML